MILESMLQRLYANLRKGPSLNARPHNSRQRIDLCQLAALQQVSVDAILPSLLGPARKITLPADPKAVRPLVDPDGEKAVENQPPGKRPRRALDAQRSVLAQLADIVVDAQDYYNDHGEEALFLGFPLVSLPAEEGLNPRYAKTGLLAPVAFIPVNLGLQRGPKPSVTLRAAGDGAELLIPNPALLAWLEQQTGREIPELFDDDTGKDPQREFSHILEFITQSLGLDKNSLFGFDVSIDPIPVPNRLPSEPALLPSAALGLFPMTNAGLLRDTKHMISNESELQGPVRSFLCHEALQLNEGLPPEQEPEVKPADQSASRRAFDDEHAIAPVDPCQARTVTTARRADALVIHGPPGTGKSQTIANIIADHLARGQRALFVCDKRTALDVVKYRLDHCDLGHLCGVIHDPSRDRRPLYVGMRERLEYLAEHPPCPDPTDTLQSLNQRLSELDRELKGYFRLLHDGGSDGVSFHALVGQWLACRRISDPEVALNVADHPQLDRALIETNRTELGEILRRAREIHPSRNPLFENVALSLEAFFQTSTAAVRQSFSTKEFLAEAVDEVTRSLSRSLEKAALPIATEHDGALRKLDPEEPLPTQAERRRAIADDIERLAEDPPSLLLEWASAAGHADFTEMDDNAPSEDKRELLEVELDREIVLQLDSKLPTMAECKEIALVMSEYQECKGRVLGFLQIRKKRAAAAVARQLGLESSEDALRILAFCRGVKARWLASDFLQRFLEDEAPEPTDDAGLKRALSACDRLLDIVFRCAEEEPDLLACLQACWAEGDSETLRDLAQALRHSAEQADRIHDLMTALREEQILTASCLLDFEQILRAGGEALPFAKSWTQHAHTIEGVIRMQEGLEKLPEAISTAARRLALHELEREAALNELTVVALRNAIQAALKKEPELLRIDTARIDAAFEEYGKCLDEKKVLARQSIAHMWESRQRQRLLGEGENRVSPVGASLRNRLFMRGKRSLKLRQVIAAGESHEGGDPLFDLCPVWMASPSTVAQIFPRKPIFDLVVFDEASQCRLEEALPILLRGNRLVIAGDPKQLPPTRFFESGIIDSDGGEAESLEELAAQQISEAEDLLSAALNLDIEEAFLDVHYRSQDAALIGFSNEHYYANRLQPIPSHPQNRAALSPIRLRRVDGLYENRINAAEADAVVELVAELLQEPEPPSIGVACFNINQRDLIIERLEAKAQEDQSFKRLYETARQRRGADSFEGLFVRNLENVQGDERDHIIVSTTFGLDAEGKFRRNFGALSQYGGERRLNVLVTRARIAIHLLTSIPQNVYHAEPSQASPGSSHFFAYLRYAEQVAQQFENAPVAYTADETSQEAQCQTQPNAYPSALAAEIGYRLQEEPGISSTIHWGNDGFCVDAALAPPSDPDDVTLGLLTDFNRFRKTPDPIAWEHFRTEILRGQGWDLRRIWSPMIAREPEERFDAIVRAHDAVVARRKRLAASPVAEPVAASE